MATGGKTYLIKNSLRRRTGTAIHENVECPALSPDAFASAKAASATRISFARPEVPKLPPGVKLPAPVKAAAKAPPPKAQ